MSRHHNHRDKDHQHEENERKEIKILKELEVTEKHIEKDLGQIIGILKPRTSHIKIAFTKGSTMAEGAVVLSSGQSTVATIDYFDQTGAPMPAGFVPPAVTYSIDNSAVASSTPGTDGQSSAVAYVSAGVANLTASVTTAEGLNLTDTETVTCSPVVAPPPVLSSVKINFSTPTP